MILVGTAGLLALAVWFMLLLLRIIASVGEGEPFTLENSKRLARMGWIALAGQLARSEEHTSELQSLMRISYAVFCLKKKKHNKQHTKQSMTKHSRHITHH